MKNWFKAAAIRAIKTMAQTAIATIGTAAVLNDVNWIAVISATILAGGLSMLTSIAGLPEVKEWFIWILQKIIYQLISIVDREEK